MLKLRKKFYLILCILMITIQSGMFERLYISQNSLVCAAANTLKVQMYNLSTSVTTNSVNSQFRISNTGTNTVNLSDIKIRYYYTIDQDKVQNFFCDYATSGSSNVTGTFVKMTPAQTGADYYLEIGFKSTAGSIAPNSTTDVQTRFSKNDWSNYTQTGDYSFNSTGTSYGDWTKVTAYFQGNLVWGTAPGGNASSTPTKTQTNTPTVTNTPTTTPTPTETTLLSFGDAYIKYNKTSNLWNIGTGSVEKKLQLNSQGQYLLTSFINKKNNTDYIQGGQLSDEFSITVDGTEFTGSNSVWTYVSHNTKSLKQGEIQLTVVLQNNAVKVERNYVIYPHTGILGEWSIYTNISSASVSFSNPSIIKQRLMSNNVLNTDFYYMTGGSNFTGSNLLKCVALTNSYQRTFDSYDSAELSTIDGLNSNGVMDNKQGSSIWNQFYALHDRISSQGIFMTFDYMGHWKSNVGNFGGNILLNPQIITTNSVESNATITTANSITGVYTGDIDDMGNSILDYIYRYKWDYTNDNYFAQVAGYQFIDKNQMTTFPNDDQMPNAFTAINLLRYVGGDMFWVDAGWYDYKGDWTSDWAGDFSQLNSFSRKSGINMGVWYPLWHADAGSKLLNSHPDYQIAGDAGNDWYGCHLNMAKSDVVNWASNILDSKQATWGDHMWRYDGEMIWAANATRSRADTTEDKDMLFQSKNFFDLLKSFKDRNKNAGIFGCSSGGELITIESSRYSDRQQSTDGWVGHLETYWNSLLTPPDKLSSAVYSYAGSWYNDLMRGGLWAAPSIGIQDGSNSSTDGNIPVTDDVKEALRKDVELYHYLKSQGAVGKGVKVYRPKVSDGTTIYDPYDDTSGIATYYLQKMDSTGTKGYIAVRDVPPPFTNHSGLTTNPMISTTLIIYPKGLIPTAQYTVSFAQGGTFESSNTGDYWMKNGIVIVGLQQKEVVFLNLSNRPGMGKDSVNPTVPSNVVKTFEKNMEHNGIGITWSSASDNNWISYYEIFKNGTSIDKVSKGTYYFDTSGSIYDNYEIRTVDGDNNVSGKVTAIADTDNLYIASDNFSSNQGQSNWNYEQRDSSGNYTDMTWDSSNNRWKGLQDYCLIHSYWQHPDTNDSVRKWTAPKTGALWISGTVSTTGTGGDGVTVSIVQGNNIIWGPKTVSGTNSESVKMDFYTFVSQGQEIRFIVDMNGDNQHDTTEWNPCIKYISDDTASKNFSSNQGNGSWYYQQSDSSGNYTDMTWDSSNNRWKGTSEFCLIGTNYQHPDTNDSVRKWIALKEGCINITGLVEKTQSLGDGVYVSIKHNNTSIWSPQLLSSGSIAHDVSVVVNKGDTIYFELNRNGNAEYDTIEWDPIINYFPSTDSMLDFSPGQGRKNWYYQQKDINGNLKNMSFNLGNSQWNGDQQFCIIGNIFMHPDSDDAVRKWVAPCPGSIEINGEVKKLDTQGDGIIFRYLKNNELIDSIVINNANKKEFSAITNVNAGDEIYFVINKNQNAEYDITDFNVKIQYK